MPCCGAVAVYVSEQPLACDALRFPVIVPSSADVPSRVVGDDGRGGEELTAEGLCDRVGGALWLLRFAASQPHSLQCGCRGWSLVAGLPVGEALVVPRIDYGGDSVRPCCRARVTGATAVGSIMRRPHWSRWPIRRQG